MLAIPAAYFNPVISIAIFVIIGVIYTAPGLLARRTAGAGKN